MYVLVHVRFVAGWDGKMALFDSEADSELRPTWSWCKYEYLWTTGAFVRNLDKNSSTPCMGMGLGSHGMTGPMHSITDRVYLSLLRHPVLDVFVLVLQLLVPLLGATGAGEGGRGGE